MITAVDLWLTELLVVLHLLYFIHIAGNISYNSLQNLLYFLPENTNISYFFKSYILVEVDFDHWYLYIMIVFVGGLVRLFVCSFCLFVSP